MRTFFENEAGTVYLTDDSVIVKTIICTTEIKPHIAVNKTQFLCYEYRNQVRQLKSLQRMFDLF